ncbi:hypothetical protein WA026_014921 [Henosepilachna vigintioctopunctata]|uniref:Reverse transcriptase domain-containing protein n=1 Tax=Henosepilachna vigintioctopunctata TaxID=420089 RepID=A0AAW1UZ13_9CUCU
MGNPLSPLCAEIFMDNLEHTIHDHPLSQRFLYWFRYVDDIICCFTGSKRQLHSFQNLINSIHPKIKFTLEEELDNSINFIDITIKKLDDKHSFSVYHKPSQTDTVIHNSSVHPIQQKCHHLIVWFIDLLTFRFRMLISTKKKA